jgi:hypothetical protein
VNVGSEGMSCLVMGGTMNGLSWVWTESRFAYLDASVSQSSGDISLNELTNCINSTSSVWLLL